MARIWFKTFFSFFLIFFLLMNFLYFFNVTGVFPNAGAISVDYSDKYFGFSTLIKFFSTGFTDSSFFNNYNRYLSQFSSMIRNGLTGQWIQLSNQGGVHDIFEALMTIVYFLRSVASILGYIVYFVMFLVYVLMLVGWCLWQLMLLFNGMFWSIVPTSPYATLILG